jgi:hypothetical protein
MGARWESVLFAGGDASYEMLASSISSIALRCTRAPKVIVHFFLRESVTSLEMTAFARRPLRLADGCASELSDRVFGGVAVFSGPEVLLAQHVSATLGNRSVYLHVNDTYNSVGYVSFAAGELDAFEIVNWQGTASRFTDGQRPPARDPKELIQRGVATLGGRLHVEALEDLFPLFYEAPTAVASFVIIDRGEVVAPPMREA